MFNLVIAAHLTSLRIRAHARERVAALRAPHTHERGDIVQTVIITAVMAGLAIIVLGIIVAVVNHWGAKIPDTTANPNGG